MKFSIVLDTSIFFSARVKEQSSGQHVSLFMLQVKGGNLPSEWCWVLGSAYSENTVPVRAFNSLQLKLNLASEYRSWISDPHPLPLSRSPCSLFADCCLPWLSFPHSLWGLGCMQCGLRTKSCSGTQVQTLDHLLQWCPHHVFLHVCAYKYCTEVTHQILTVESSSGSSILHFPCWFQLPLILLVPVQFSSFPWTKQFVSLSFPAGS